VALQSMGGCSCGGVPLTSTMLSPLSRI
jgi:hypothetical protein